MIRGAGVREIAQPLAALAALALAVFSLSVLRYAKRSA
jgi:hypothetical protein